MIVKPQANSPVSQTQTYEICRAYIKQNETRNVWCLWGIVVKTDEPVVRLGCYSNVDTAMSLESTINANAIETLEMPPD